MYSRFEVSAYTTSVYNLCIKGGVKGGIEPYMTLCSNISASKVSYKPCGDILTSMGHHQAAHSSYPS